MQIHVSPMQRRARQGLKHQCPASSAHVPGATEPRGNACAREGLFNTSAAPNLCLNEGSDQETGLHNVEEAEEGEEA